MTPTDQLPAYLSPSEPATGGGAGGFPAAGSGLRPAGTGLATAALVVGIVAFLAGWVPFLAAISAIVGIVLGILAIRTRRAPVRSIIGLSLSGFALLTNIIVSSIMVVALLNNGGVAGFIEAAADPAGVSTAKTTTPCYSFDTPTAYINNQSDLATTGCITTEQLWGEYNADGTVNNTGVGEILGSVSVDPVSTVKSDEVNPDGTLEGMVEFLNTDFIPDMGTVIGESETITVDGLPASLTRVTSTVAKTKTKALLVLRAPDVYQVPDEDTRFFLVSFVTPEDNGEAIIDAAIESWTWK